MFKRYFLFFVTNILVSIMLWTLASFVMRYLGISTGSYQGLMIFALMIGMGGSFISLMMSKWMAKRMMGLEAATQVPGLTQRVHSLARRSGLSEMPEVYIFRSSQVNAFATGPSRNNSLVAVSTGLLNNMSEDEVDAVLAHEVAHIANGDMVTMTLIQGVANAMALFASWIISQFIMNAMRGDDDEGGSIGDFFLYHLIHNLVYTAVSLLALPIVMWFSRWREYRADAHSGKLVGNHKMIAALEALKRNYGQLETKDKNMEVMAISAKSSFAELFSSHPDLDKRIQALR